jgi:hypothetical protein
MAEARRQKVNASSSREFVMTRRPAKVKAKSPASPAPRTGGDLFVHPAASTFTGEVDKDLDAKIAALPFVRSRKRGEKGERCFWSVTASGKYGEDYDQGKAWARLVLPLLKFNIGAPLLSWIVADMIKAGEKNGLVLGFVREVADQLKSSRGNLLFAAIATGQKTPANMRKHWLAHRSKIASRMIDAL